MHCFKSARSGETYPFLSLNILTNWTQIIYYLLNAFKFYFPTEDKAEADTEWFRKY